MSATTPDSSEMDLPLSANIAVVKIKHFLLNLKCNMESRELHGCLTLFCSFPHLCDDQASQTNAISDLKSSSDDASCTDHKHSTLSRTATHTEPVIILDCFGLCISSVQQLSSNPELDNLISRQSHKHTSEAINLCLEKHRVDSQIDSSNEDDLDSKNHIRIDSQIRSSNEDEPESENCTRIDSHIHVHSSNKDCPENHVGSEEPTRACDKDGIYQQGSKLARHSELNIGKQSQTSDGDEDIFKQCSKLCGDQLNFDLCKHSVKISGLLPTQRGSCVIRIHYKTLPEGPSLKWTLDQDGNPCVFTIGHWLNNRSWFPSQDAPTVLTTWQARITVERECMVLMSGDRDADISTSSPDMQTFHYHTTMPMPTSTLALAVGYWKQMNISSGSPTSSNNPSSHFLCASHGEKCQTNYSDKQVLPCRLFAPTSLMTVAMSELEHYVPTCLEKVYQLLGHHPFQRLDILIVPSCFDSLGMTSPSLLFLAQSVLVGDQSMCVRVAHEICHSWFGLLIGPKDWTEEWLTEGFCTYLEDILHARVMGWEEDEMSNHLTLRCLLKERILRAEVQNTEENLQTLRPNKGEEQAPLDGCTSVQYVKNGMNPDKAFMQVHYLKGFFLLKFLEREIGVERFLAFLKDYVKRFHGELVTSQDFFDLLFSSCSGLSTQGVTKERLFEDWLDCPGIPKSLKDMLFEKDNVLLSAVKDQVMEIQKACLRHRQGKGNKQKKRKLSFKDGLKFAKLHPDQLVLLLDLLLDEDEIPKPILDALRANYSLQTANAEVRHRWCELVVREKAVNYYDDVRSFLVHNQALGVYLYGEMIISDCIQQKRIAMECFHLLKRDMPEGVIKTVHGLRARTFANKGRQNKKSVASILSRSYSGSEIYVRNRAVHGTTESDRRHINNSFLQRFIEKISVISHIYLTK